MIIWLTPTSSWDQDLVGLFPEAKLGTGSCYTVLADSFCYDSFCCFSKYDLCLPRVQCLREWEVSHFLEALFSNLF